MSYLSHPLHAPTVPSPVACPRWGRNTEKEGTKFLYPPPGQAPHPELFGKGCTLGRRWCPASTSQAPLGSDGFSDSPGFDDLDILEACWPGTVLVPRGCYNEVSQTGQLERTETKSPSSGGHTPSEGARAGCPLTLPAPDRAWRPGVPQLWPAEPSLSWSLRCDPGDLECGVQAHTRCFWLILCFLGPALHSAISPKSLVSFNRK